MPGFTFPSVGPLGLCSPPSRPSNDFGLRYYDPLRLPLLRLGALRITLDSRYLALSRLRSPRVRVGELSQPRLAVLVSRFASPGVPRKEITVLSSFQATPLHACPARGPRWCPLDSPCRLQDRCLPVQSNRRLSSARAELSSWTTTINFSELSHEAYTLATPGFTHTLAGCACRFTTDSAAHLL